MCKLAIFAEHVYNHKFDTVVWLYEGPPSSLPSLESIPNLIIQHGVPTSFEEFPLNSLILIDDCSKQTANSKALLESAIQGCHHRQQSIVIALHNIFTTGENFRTLSLNSHYFILFKALRDRRQIYHFFQQLQPQNWKQFANIFDKEMAEGLHKYICVDCHPRSETNPYFRIKGSIFPSDAAGFVYTDNEQSLRKGLLACGYGEITTPEDNLGGKI